MVERMKLLLSDSKEYPALLREIPDPPKGIYVRGILSSDAFAIGIVGTRRATPGGKTTAREFARALARAGIIIVSGLAFGIDAAAHEGCLEGGGKTIAVLAGGLDKVYPESNTRLAEKILAAGGAIVSEYPPGTPPYASNFLERNRIVSGLSKGVLIVEAPENSGALVTARRAARQNRDVFVVPGSIGHGNFKGSHALIRQGAELVTDPEEIFAAYSITKEQRAAREAAAASPEETLILKALRESSSALNVDKIIEATRLEPRIANQTISFLLVRNAIKELDTGYIMN
jgi:DNA processing protein